MSATVRSYHHVQVGWVIVGVTLIALTILLLVMSAGASSLLMLFPLVITTLTLTTFGFMTVTVDDRQVGIRMGIGLVRQLVVLQSIREFRKVRNPWFYGWGIKKYPGGTLYNVSGRSAVELDLGGGRSIRIGSDEPDALMAAMRRAIEHAAS